MNRFLLVSLIYILFLNLSSGQERLGLSLENYAGINSVSLNPANPFITSHKWDINILSSEVFFDNNYAFLKNTNTVNLLKNIENIKIVYEPEKNINTSYPPGTELIDFNNRKKESLFFASGNFMGPSFSIKTDKTNMWGIVSAFRFYGSFPKIPEELEYYTYSDKPYFQSYPIPSFDLGYMSWQEYGINYVKNIKGYYTNTLIGITVKYLSGNEALFFENKKTFQFEQMPNDSVAALDQISLQYGYTSSSLRLNNFQFKNNGTGVSLDLGATMVFGDDIKNHKLRIGVSLMDVGFINYNKNSLEYTINIDTFKSFDISGFGAIEHFSQLDSAKQIINEQLNNNPKNSSISNSFKMWLPMALSVQFDYSFSELFYINATLLQRIITKGHHVIRGNLLAISPRIEHRWFSVSTPLVLYNWKDFRIGTSIRLAYLIIGSDNVFSLFSNHAQYSGTDLYMGLKFNPFSIYKRNKYSRNLNKNIKCYEF
ncbi:MAG TPA: hypothetical protein ENI82_00120 [Bacteroidetes bacterium]|nr:hypothetical protein [Bacteroidota bacterium]